MKKIYVEVLKEGDHFEDLFLVKSVKLGETRAGKPYLVLTVMDKTGDVTGPVWDNAKAVYQKCKPGTVVRCRAQVQLYREKIQLKFDNIEVVEDNIDLGAFFPSSPKCRKEMAADLQKIVNTVTNPHLKSLLLYFFKTSDWWPKFIEAPAAKGAHHAYIGGLLEHSLSVAKVVGLLAKHYEGVDRSLLIAGAMLHDIGKVQELLVENGVIDYSVEGRLKGHLVIGCEMVAQTAAKMKDFPPDLLAQLQHLIISHHGRLEFGSPVVPMTVEAFILNLVDDLDAKMNMIEQLRRKMQSEEMEWTEYQRLLERYLYLGGFDKTMAPDAPKKTEVPGHQPTLF